MFNRSTCIVWLTKWLDLIRAPGDVDTSQIGVAVSLDKLHIQRSQSVDVGIIESIRVPCSWETGLVAVDKRHRRGKEFVMIDYVSQVGVRLEPLVHGCTVGWAAT